MSMTLIRANCKKNQNSENFVFEIDEKFSIVMLGKKIELGNIQALLSG